ncbi:hypothetical protein LCGC14_2698110 [marine sediment metagenome]|uniref:Uncharacterized protein n=1 Tax=marine sediment metagenome TaxID=412755 RepID=A0A0F9BR07_9ZZZZ
MIIKRLSDEAKNKIADALGCGLCVCREDCLNGRPFKDCPHSKVLPRLIIEAQEAKRYTLEQVVQEIDRVGESHEDNYDFVIIPETFVKELKQQSEEGR